MLFWIGVWQIISMVVDLELLLPSPYSTVKRLLELMLTKEYYLIILRSLLRVMLGTLAAVILGVILGIASAKVKLVHDILSPLMTVIKAIPVASFIILLLLWIGADILPAVISSLIVLPIVWHNIETGILRTDKELLEMARVYRMGKWNRIMHIYAPSAFPYFTASLKSSLGLSWKAGIAAEVLAVPVLAIGTQIRDAKFYLETLDLFAWTLTVIILSLIIEKLIIFGIGKLFSRKKRTGGEI